MEKPGPEGGYAYDTRMAVAGSYLEDYKAHRNENFKLSGIGKEVHDDALFWCRIKNKFVLSR